MNFLHCVACMLLVFWTPRDVLRMDASVVTNVHFEQRYACDGRIVSMT